MCSRFKEYMGHRFLILAYEHLKRPRFLLGLQNFSYIFAGNLETFMLFCKTQAFNEVVTKAGRC